MKKIQFILFILILFLVPHVFALEVDVTNSVTSPETSGTGKYRGTEILNTGTQATYNVKTRYQGRLSRIIFNLPLPSELGDCFSTNTTYTVTMYMETNDWNNKFGSVKVRPYSSSSTNWSNGNVTFVSYKKIYFTFKIPSSDTTCYDFVWVDLPSINISNTGITQISNWNLNKITLTDPTISSGGSSGGSGTTPTPTPDNTQQIIDNQNENTQNIVDSQNENTNNIIENNNQNTEKMIEEIKTGSIVCGYKYKETFKYEDMTNQGWLTSTDSVGSSNSFRYSDYIPIFGGNVYDVDGFSTGTSTYYNLNVYDKDKNFLFNFNYATYDELDLRFYTGLLFFRINVNVNTGNNVMVVQNDGICVPTSYVQSETNNAINQLNDSINNDNIDNGLGGSFFSDFDDQDFGLSSIITIPLNTIQSLTSTSCQTLSIPIPFTSSSVPLPCMSAIYEEHIPTIYNLWKIVSFGLIAYFIAIDIFHMVKGFKDPESDKVEVLDL